MITLSCSRFFAPEGFVQDLNWKIRKSSHFVFYYREDSYAEQCIDSIIAIEEWAYRYIIDTLDLSYNGIISVYLYDSPEDAGWDRIKAMAYPRNDTVEAVYSTEEKSIGVKGVACHEITHIITWNSLGEAGTQFLSEGIAVAMDGEWHSSLDTITDLHVWVRKFIEDGTLPQLTTIISDWSSIPGSIPLPVSGSFVSYLLTTYGSDKFKELFYSATEESFSTKLSEIYGKTLEDIEIAWQQYCEASP